MAELQPEEGELRAPLLDSGDGEPDSGKVDDGGVADVESGGAPEVRETSGSIATLEEEGGAPAGGEGEAGAPAEKKKKKRLKSLDVCRGLAILGMMLVDNQGHFATVVIPFREDHWDGVHFPADYVFALFLWIMGFATTLALRSKPANGATLWAISKRAFRLFLVGAVLNLLADNLNFITFSIMGVLQRIAICYWFVAVLHKFTSPSTLRGVSLLSAVLYTVVMYAVYIPGCGVGHPTFQCNAASYIDHAVFPGRIPPKTTLHEGLLSTLGAFITSHVGLEFGLIMQSVKSSTDGQRLRLLSAWACAALAWTAAGFFLTLWWPFNKPIWSISFALLTGGVSGWIMIFCFILVDVWAPQQGSWQAKLQTVVVEPNVWFGKNPLVLFAAMVEVEIILLDNIKLNSHDPSAKIQNGWDWMFYNMFASWLPNEYAASTAMSLFFTFIWLAVAAGMHKKKWYIRV
eukprot:PLAT14771.1.p2 GENE.PLAT14771.1~~PLAT14771.1.p2  ORF type:complete len:473 (+),score=259.68 PLAT14771.1:42-1421(+)